MPDASELLLLCGVTAAINVTYAVQNKHSVAGSVIASGASFAGLAVLGGVWREDVAVAVAGLLFFAALILRGLPVISSVTQLSTGSK